MRTALAAWIDALGLEPRPDGYYVSGNYYRGAGICLEYYLLTSGTRVALGRASADSLYFHHAGGALRVVSGGGDEEHSLERMLGPPAGFQVEVDAGRWRALELVSGAWGLISAATVPRPAADRGALSGLRPDGVASFVGEAVIDGEFLTGALGLAPHREGGFYRELYKAEDRVAGRRLASTIYYLLTSAAPIGRFHRNVSDITHFLHAGGPIIYKIISPEGEWREVVLGYDLAAGQVLQFTCPGGFWKSSHLPAGVGYGLISEIVVPGYDDADQSLADGALFARLFPQHRARWGPYVGEGAG